MFLKKISFLLVYCLSIYLRYTPIEYGRWRLLTIARKYLQKLYPVNCELEIDTRHGFKVKVNLDDYVKQELFLWGEYEPDVTTLLKNILKEGDCFVDVGANIGYFSLLASKIVGEKGYVHAFEPIFTSELANNISINKYENCNYI